MCLSLRRRIHLLQCRGCYDCHGKSEGIYTAYKYMYILPWELEGICTAHKYMYMRRLQ